MTMMTQGTALIIAFVVYKCFGKHNNGQIGKQEQNKRKALKPFKTHR